MPELEFDEARLTSRVATELQTWLEDSGLTPEQMVQRVGKFQPKVARTRQRWYAWRDNPRSLSVLTYMAIREVAQSRLQDRQARRRALGNDR